MKRRWIAGLVAGLALCVMLSVSFAQGGGGGRQGRGPRAGRPGAPPAPADQAKMREMGMVMSATRVLAAAAELPEAKAARQAYLQEAEPIMKEVRDAYRKPMREMRKARREGADREDMRALMKQAQADAAEASKKLVPMQIAFCKKLVEIAEKNPDKVSAKMAEMMAGRLGGGLGGPPVPPVGRGVRGVRRGGRDLAGPPPLENVEQ